MSSNAKKVVYVTREIERALGMDPSPDFIVVSNDTPYGQHIQKLFPEGVVLLSHPEHTLQGTGELLSHAELKHIISDPAMYDLLVFKNTPRVEQSARMSGWTLLNPKASLSEQVENKISQIDWLGALEHTYLPRHRIVKARNIIWNGKPTIIQWAHGHTGSGTILITEVSQLDELKTKFPERLARVTEYIEGPSYTVNVVVASDKVLVSTPSYQITGITPFTDNTFSTVGNDWSYATTSLSYEDISAIEDMAHNIGKKLNINGWRGLFGIDVIKSTHNGRIYLIEINARQPASTTFESQLQQKERKKGSRGITTFEAHIRALRNEPIDNELIPVPGGAQIIQRVTHTRHTASTESISHIESLGHTTIIYNNDDIGSDLMRIQTQGPLMEGHNVLNATGKEIVKALNI